MVMASMVMATHIDDTNGELSNFKYDKVIFRLQKDCSLDKIPDVSYHQNDQSLTIFQIKYFLEQDSAKYPGLDVFLSGKQKSLVNHDFQRENLDLSY